MENRFPVATIFFSAGEGAQHIEISDFDVPEGFSKAMDDTEEQFDKESFVLTCICLSLYEYVMSISEDPFLGIKLIQNMYGNAIDAAVNAARNYSVQDLLDRIISQLEDFKGTEELKEEGNETDS